jgi:hypothetical protein
MREHDGMTYDEMIGLAHSLGPSKGRWWLKEPLFPSP